MIEIHSEDCVGSERITDESVHLGIFDPPFSIGESGFDRHHSGPSRNSG